MVTWTAVGGVAVIALGMVLTPGPNMVYLASRSISQGRVAGLISLAGVGLGFLVYMVAAGLGLAALFDAVPAAYTVLKLAGAGYLLYLAWGMLRPGGMSPFEPRLLEPHSPARLFTMGLVTNLLNPKIALMYASLIPQFVKPDEGSVFGQFLLLGLVQISIALSINGSIVLAADQVSRFLKGRPWAIRLQRGLAGTLLGVFAVRLALTKRPA
ncbi:LysE family translocator [Kineosporia sp. J2-2]|uniref:LysE family translocator n=1 Tax=Kineosporia corallincola TaxID=2835133 RepID=A0ABS5TQG1_9ACTN|nr:LysE family translocator [Kineosporia corallincola]MBT0773322.1 LysE family translocator [Kineosporia corallincola]